MVLRVGLPPPCGGNPLAPPVGLEPTTARLTAACSTNCAKEECSGPNSIESRPVLALPILPGRCQPSIVSRDELNYRVRNGNGWTLILISTNYCYPVFTGTTIIIHLSSRLVNIFSDFRPFRTGDPYRIRTDVNGVRGRCLNHLTNGPLVRLHGLEPGTH